MYCPAQADGIIVLLPDSLHLHVQLFKKQISVKSEAPEDQFVVVQTVERIPGVTKCHIIPEYSICRHNNTGKSIFNDDCTSIGGMCRHLLLQGYLLPRELGGH